MPVRFTLTRILPFALLYVGLLGAAIALDFLLHTAGLAWIGRYLGPIGTSTILVSFAYSLRKRGLVRWGKPSWLLRSHEALGWTGALMLLVHGGIHFNALLPWLAITAMLVVVASGLTGKFLLKDARGSLKAREAELRAGGATPADIETALLGHSLLVSTMQKWRKVHMPLTMTFAGFALVHVATTLIFWRWLP